jgi:hypothetical protein
MGTKVKEFTRGVALGLISLAVVACSTEAPTAEPKGMTHSNLSSNDLGPYEFCSSKDLYTAELGDDGRDLVQRPHGGPADLRVSPAALR